MTRQLERPCLGLFDPDTHVVVPCGRPAVGPRCERHQAAYDAQRRPSPSARGYDAAYRADRAVVLAPDALGRPRRCSLRLPGCTTWATTADHVDPVDGGRNKRRGPLRPACAHCNSSRGKRPIEAAVGAVESDEADARMLAEMLDRIEDAREKALADAVFDPEFWHPDP